MTIDVEDYFHANALSSAAPVSSWPSLESQAAYAARATLASDLRVLLRTLRLLIAR